MVMLPWWLFECKVWKAEADRLLQEWARRTGRVCPACGHAALVGHGRRRRSVHCGVHPGLRWLVCDVLWFEVQRVRCCHCGKTHTLLPGFLARHQRHPNRVRQEAVRLREAGLSWSAVLQALRPLGVPLATATSPRRWVQGVQARMAGAAAELARLQQPADGRPRYGSVQRPGSWAAFAELVRDAAQAEGWQAAGEELAAANRLGRGQWAV